MKMRMTFNTVGLPSLPYCRGTYCLDWDGPCPSYLTDKRTGHTFGRLMPILNNPHPGGTPLLGYQRHS